MRLLIALLAVATLGAFPDKPVKIVVPYPPGGAVDVVTRKMAAKLQEQTNQTFFVENKAGAGGNIGADFVARSDADGTTLLVSPPGPIAINHHLYKSLSFDPVKWVPVTVIATVPNVMAVSNKVPAKSVQEFVDYVKANPGKYFFASSGLGTVTQMSVEMLRKIAGLDMTHVPYRGSGLQVTGLLGGHSLFGFGQVNSSLPHVRSGKLRALATTGQSAGSRSDRARAIGAWAGLGGIAAAVGPLVGGLLINTVGWRAIFWTNVPVAAAALWATLRHVPESRATVASRRFDVEGAALATIAFLAWQQPESAAALLEPGVTYTVTVANNFAAMDGSRLVQPYRFSFVVRGARVLTGLLAKRDPKAVQVNMLAVVIGIRGTGFDNRIAPDCVAGVCSDAAFAYTWEGTIAVQVGDRSLLIETGRAGVYNPAQDRLVLLDQVPQFFLDETTPRPDKVEVDFDKLFGLIGVGYPPGVYGVSVLDENDPYRLHVPIEEFRHAIDFRKPLSNVHVFDGVRHVPILLALRQIYSQTVTFFFDVPSDDRYARFRARMPSGEQPPDRAASTVCAGPDPSAKSRVERPILAPIARCRRGSPRLRARTRHSRATHWPRPPRQARSPH